MNYYEIRICFFYYKFNNYKISKFLSYYLLIIILQVSTVSTNETDIKEVFRRKPDDTMDIWEIASQIDKHIPEDIWDVVCM